MDNKLPSLCWETAVLPAYRTENLKGENTQSCCREAEDTWETDPESDVTCHVTLADIRTRLKTFYLQCEFISLVSEKTERECSFSHLLWPFCAPASPSEETSLTGSDARTPLDRDRDRDGNRDGEGFSELCWGKLKAQRVTVTGTYCCQMESKKIHMYIFSYIKPLKKQITVVFSHLLIISFYFYKKIRSTCNYGSPERRSAQVCDFTPTSQLV